MRASIILLVFILPFCLCAKPKEKAKHNQMALKDDLRAYWKMEQNPALFTVHDESGNGNHLTGFNAPTLTTGKIGQGIEFDGVNQYLNLTSSSGISHQGNEFTVSVWVKPLALIHFGHIMSTTEWGIGIRLVGANYYFNIAVEDEELTSTVPLELGQWYFIALGWYDTNGVFAWASVNLEERLRVAQSAVTPSPNSAFNIGNAGAFPVAFVVDEAAIWRRNVPAYELYQIFNDRDGLPFEEWGTAAPCKTIDCCD